MPQVHLDYLAYQPSYINMRNNTLCHPFYHVMQDLRCNVHQNLSDILHTKQRKIKTRFLKWNFYWLKIGLTRRLHQEAIPKRGNCVKNTEKITKMAMWKANIQQVFIFLGPIISLTFSLLLLLKKITGLHLPLSFGTPHFNTEHSRSLLNP